MQVEHRDVGRMGYDGHVVEITERRRELPRVRDVRGHPRQDLVEAVLGGDKGPHCQRRAPSRWTAAPCSLAL